MSAAQLPHLSGAYLVGSERGHVSYESRLERARLLFADFDSSVNRIFAQPFLLKAGLKVSVRRHMPDFLLLSEAGPTVVHVRWESGHRMTLAEARPVGDVVLLR